MKRSHPTEPELLSETATNSLVHKSADMCQACFSCAGRRSSPSTSLTQSVCVTTCSWRHHPPPTEAEMTQIIRHRCGRDCVTSIRGCSRSSSGSATSTASSIRSSTPSSTASSGVPFNASYIADYLCTAEWSASRMAPHTLDLARQRAGGVAPPTCSHRCTLNTVHTVTVSVVIYAR